MMCEICSAIKKKENVIYETKNVSAFLSKTPSTLGHVVVTTKEHYPIMENVPDYIIGEIFRIVNKISTAVFEVLSAEGTNIIVNNGIEAGQKKPHFCVNIIPRKRNDNLSFQWKAKQLSEEEMSTIELKLKEGAKDIGAFEKEKKEPVKVEKKIEKISKNETMLIKQLERLP